MNWNFCVIPESDLPHPISQSARRIVANMRIFPSRSALTAGEKGAASSKRVPFVVAGLLVGIFAASSQAEVRNYQKTLE